MRGYYLFYNFMARPKKQQQTEENQEVVAQDNAIQEEVAIEEAQVQQTEKIQEVIKKDNIVQKQEEKFILLQDMGAPFGKKGDIISYENNFQDIKKNEFDEIVQESIRLGLLKIYE